MAFADVDDLQERFPRALTPAETVQAEVLLEDASFLLSIQAPGAVGAVDSGNENVSYAAMLLVVRMVKRTLIAEAAQQTANPGVEQVSETWGTYSQSIRFKSNGGDLWLYPSEIEYLLALLRGDNATAVSMRSPGL